MPISARMKRRLHLSVIDLTGGITIALAFARGGTSTRSLVTIALVVELLIRFRYIIGLLDWPITASRIALIFGFWVTLIPFGWAVEDPKRWATLATMLFAIGVLIEVHNLVTRQWAIGDERFQRSLRNDVLRGIASAAFATASTPIVYARWPQWIALYVGGLIAADVLRFSEMVIRHRRLRR